MEASACAAPGAVALLTGFYLTVAVAPWAILLFF